MSIDTALVGALHVEYLKARDLGQKASLHHALFQTSRLELPAGVDLRTPNPSAAKSEALDRV